MWSEKLQRYYYKSKDPNYYNEYLHKTKHPMTCGFCLPGGPESMIEVRAKTPVKYSMEIVVVEGKFAVLNDDPYGLYYRMTDAVSIK